MVSQYDGLLRDARFDGVNAATGDMRAVRVNERGTTLDIGRTLGALSERLGLEEIEVFDLIEAKTLEATIASLDKALDTIETRTHHLTNNLAALDIRGSFNAALRNTLKAGADALTLADTDEAGAKVLAARTPRDAGLRGADADRAERAGGVAVVLEVVTRLEARRQRVCFDGVGIAAARSSRQSDHFVWCACTYAFKTAFIRVR